MKRGLFRLSGLDPALAELSRRTWFTRTPRRRRADTGSPRPSATRSTDRSLGGFSPHWGSALWDRHPPLPDAGSGDLAAAASQRRQRPQHRPRPGHLRSGRRRTGFNDSCGTPIYDDFCSFSQRSPHSESYLLLFPKQVLLKLGKSPVLRQKYFTLSCADAMFLGRKINGIFHLSDQFERGGSADFANRLHKILQLI